MPPIATEDTEKPKPHFHIAHVEVYRIVDGQIEFLLIRRTPEEGGWWQPVTGTMEEGEEPHETMHREIGEELGLKSEDVLHASEKLHETDWESDDCSGTDHVHAVEIAPHTEVVLNPQEHDAYLWLSPEKAIQTLRFDGNRDSMRKVHEYIQSRLALQ